MKSPSQSKKLRIENNWSQDRSARRLTRVIVAASALDQQGHKGWVVRESVTEREKVSIV